MPRTIAALIRHGDYHQLPETPSAHQPFPLTAEGFDQAGSAARAFAALLSAMSWTPAQTIHSSNMQRAWQTAGIFMDVLIRSQTRPDLRVQGFDALAERGLGCAANLSIKAIEDMLEQDPRYGKPPPDWKSNSHYRLPLQGAESLMQAGQRVAAHLRQTMQDLVPVCDVDTVQLFVGHGAAFRHAACELGVLSFGQLARLSMYHAKPVLIEYLPTGEWHHIGGDWKVREPKEALD